MKVLTKAIQQQLIKNGEASKAAKNVDSNTPDHKPVVKLFGGSSCTWLLSEIDPDDHDLAFGLCDIGHGSPETGYLSLSEIIAARFPPFGLPVERDRHWTAKMTLSAYAEQARAASRIVA